MLEWRGVTSASRVYGNASYEISDDLQRRTTAVLERRYDGRDRAHRAATIIQRAYRHYKMSSRFKQMTGEHSQGASSHSNGFTTPDRTRYAPTTSLSAQLRADRTTHSMVNDRSRTRSPPSPSPRGRQEYSMIDSLMSPRLTSRRVPQSMSSHPLHPSAHSSSGIQPTHYSASTISMSPSTIHSTSSSVSQDHPLQNGYIPPHVQNAYQQNVWVQRGNGAFHQSAMHCNSLPRLEKKHRKQRPEEPICTPRRLSELERKRQYRIALNFFNKKPERGIQLLIAWEFVDESAESVAKLLFGRRVDIRGLDVDVALRKCNHFFRLPGESQKIEHIMENFSLHYARSNPARALQFHGGHKTVFILSYAIIMLNTDLHNKNVKQSERMKKDQFINNLRGIDEGGNIDRDMLGAIYDRIKEEAFQPGDDHVAQVARVESAILGQGKPRLSESHRRLVCYCRLNQIVDISKKQPSTSHERDVFLFNDMIVITKASGVRRHSPSQQYTLRAHSSLFGARVETFSRGTYDFGIRLTTPDHQTLDFNARNHDDRCRFVADVGESILECHGMESVRIELEMERISLRTDSQRDSGLPDGEGDDDGDRTTTMLPSESDASESGPSKLSKMAALLNRNRKTQIKETQVGETSSAKSEITPEMRASSLGTFWGPGKTGDSSNGKQSGGKSTNVEEESEIDREIRERREALLGERIKRAKAAILREAEREKSNGRLETRPIANKEFLSRTLDSIVSSDRREEKRRERAQEAHHQREREKEQEVLQRLRDRERREARRDERKTRDTSKEKRQKGEPRSPSRSRSIEIIDVSSKSVKEKKKKEEKQKKKDRNRKNRSGSRQDSKKKHIKEKTKHED
ncbi:unnamed protein product, partial [Mesorhabditis belari]|uniref:SEC7 domain-containing protein n=1 Tax=Mesorhabditis belari TaxID=2138241 RepID=A0AAF3FLK1_9BILA